MDARSNNTLRAGGVLAVLAAAGAGYGLYRHGKAAQADLVITGTTGVPPAVVRPAALPPMSSPSTIGAAAAPSAQNAQPAAPEAPPKPAELVVHVAGAVKKPGVYHFPPQARADDALKAAGGARTEANLDAINLAAHLEDGEQLYIPTRKEQPEGGALPDSHSAPPAASLRPRAGSVSTVTAAAGHGGRAAAKGDKLTTPGQGTVNINTAGAEELERLPGVGPAMSARILQFRRDNGPFTAVEQLMDVSGIGDKKFDKMRPFVRIR